MKELHNELSRQKQAEAQKCGGPDHNYDYETQEICYCDKPDHKARSMANDNGQHERHWGKER